MLDNLTQRLSQVVRSLRGQARLTEANIQDALREVRVALLSLSACQPSLAIAEVVVKSLRFPTVFGANESSNFGGSVRGQVVTGTSFLGRPTSS